MEEDDRCEQMRPLLTTGHDEEAVVDLGKTSSTINTNFEKEELESHRAVYIGVHVPLGRQSRRRHRHRGHRHHRRRKDRGSDREDGRESPTYDTPSQRVQFILGTEDDDEEHIPHDLFTELDELSFRDGHATEWKETARWLKFEEDVEDGGERWSKPYVATLSLHSLFELRSCIMNGTVLLDMRANTLDEIADMIMDSMVASGQLDESLREKVREAMLKRHHHQNEKKLSNRIPLVRSFADIGKKHSDPHLLEKNGEGLSASHLSLLRTGLSASSLSLRRDSRMSALLNSLLPGASPAVSRASTPQPSPPNTPPPTPAAPLRSESCPPQLPAPEPLAIPEVVVHPPEEDEEEERAELRLPPQEGKYLGPPGPLLCIPPAWVAACRDHQHHLGIPTRVTSRVTSGSPQALCMAPPCTPWAVSQHARHSCPCVAAFRASPSHGGNPVTILDLGLSLKYPAALTEFAEEVVFNKTDI